MTNKKMLSFTIAFVVLIGVLFTYFYSTSGKLYQGISMFMYIEEKEHHIEPGKYMKMWVVGFNANEKDPNREKYKVVIDDSRIYNLIEEGQEYFVSIHGIKKRGQPDFTYTFGQIGLPEGTQLAGKGVVE